MAKRIALVQSNYIPWKGYFDLIRSVDEFVLYDDVQFTTRDWRNRNCIKTPRGTQWLTIPVKHKTGQKIREAVISDRSWKDRHWKTIALYYSKAPHFASLRGFFEELFMGCDDTLLSRVNYRFISSLCGLLGIGTKISWSMDYRLKGSPTERIVDLCKQARAGVYLTGPKAKAYMDEALFHQKEITLEYADYRNYPQYSQLYPPFVHEVSIVDLLLNTGKDAVRYMRKL